MKKAAIILLIIAYVPFFFYSKGRIGEIFNDMYGILTAMGIGLYILGDFFQTKRFYLVPLISFFIVISLIFLLNTLIDGFYSTHKPVLLIIITLLLCYITLAFLWYKFKR